MQLYKWKKPEKKKGKKKKNLRKREVGKGTEAMEDKDRLRMQGAQSGWKMNDGRERH